LCDIKEEDEGGEYLLVGNPSQIHRAQVSLNLENWDLDCWNLRLMPKI